MERMKSLRNYLKDIEEDRFRGILMDKYLLAMYIYEPFQILDMSICENKMQALFISRILLLPKLWRLQYNIIAVCN